MLFITFEGIDASGKTTQLELLKQELTNKGYNVLVTRQPGGTKIGQQIRQILLNPAHTEMVPQAELLLYMADRVQHIQEVIEPALQAGKIVLCDRYHDATIAYQGGGRGLDLSWIQQLEKETVRTPDLTLWFELSVEESQKRLNSRNQATGEENCRIEREKQEFFIKVNQGYREIQQSDPDRFLHIDAEQTIEKIQTQVTAIVHSRLANR